MAVRRLRTVDGVVDRDVLYYDVYDMNSISHESQPEYRVEGNRYRHNDCASKGFPGRLLATDEGRLAYERRMR